MTRDHVGGPWREPVELRDVKCQLGGWAPDGSSVLCSDYKSTLTVVSPTGRVLWRRDLLATYRLRPQAYPGVFSRDGATLYVIAAQEDGRRGVWGIPVGGGPARLVVSSDDPALFFFGFLSVGPDRLYATVSEYRERRLGDEAALVSFADLGSRRREIRQAWSTGKAKHKR